jgi:CHAD domain-containing protein
MARTDHLEREVKLAAGLDFTLPDLGFIAGDTIRLPEQSLRTAYFDTRDLRLWGRGITLRHREGEGDRGLWTMKLPEEGTDSALERTELSWPGPRQHVPVEALDLLKGVVRRGTLVEVVELESVRKRLKLGSSLGEIDDDVVTVKSGVRKGYIFRQIELEFGAEPSTVASGRQTIDAVLNQLRHAGAYPDGEQKFSKALNLNLRAVATSAPKGRHHATIRSAVELSIRNGLDQLLDHDVLLRLTPADPPKRSVHQARVATRRLRSDLKTFRSLLDPVWLEHTTTELKWLGTMFGQVRDLDVLTERLESSDVGTDVGTDDGGEAERDGGAELGAILDRQRQGAILELGESLQSDRYLELLERLAAASSLPPLRDPGPGAASAADVFPSLVRHQYKALRHRVDQGGRHPEDAQLHRIRIGAKQLRYAAEAATPFVGKAARRTGKQAKQLQTILGEHHDAVAAEAWLRQVEGEATYLGGFAAGRLVAAARAEKVKRAKRWKRVWRDIHGGTRWMYR